MMANTQLALNVLVSGDRASARQLGRLPDPERGGELLEARLARSG
jgi:hypothetical protein